MISDGLDGRSDNVGGEQQETKTNLIVNYLPENMTQDEITSLFSGIGIVKTCKLVTRKYTGQSLGYAFVDYHRPEDAEKAIGTLNKLRLQHKTIKVAYARPSSEEIQRANLYVSGIPKKMTQQEFEAIFSPFGRIIASRILYDNTTVRQFVPESGESLPGLSQGVGFIRFDLRMEAERAMQELNGTILEGATVPITINFTGQSKCYTRDILPWNNHPTPMPRRKFPYPFHYPTRRFRCTPLSGRPFANYMLPATAINGSLWTIFVYNLKFETEDALWHLFSPFGAVQSVKVMRDVQTKQCRGFGFVKMTNYADAVAAIHSLNGYMLGNRILQVSFKKHNSVTTRSD